MNIVLQITLSALLIFGIETHVLTLQEPLHRKAQKSCWRIRLHSQRKTDTDSEDSQKNAIDSDYISEDNSSSRHSSQSDEQIRNTLNTLNIPDTNATSQEFQQLNHTLYPLKPSCCSCLLSCYKKRNKQQP